VTSCTQCEPSQRIYCLSSPRPRCIQEMVFCNVYCKKEFQKDRAINKRVNKLRNVVAIFAEAVHQFMTARSQLAFHGEQLLLQEMDSVVVEVEKFNKLLYNETFGSLYKKKK